MRLSKLTSDFVEMDAKGAVPVRHRDCGLDAIDQRLCVDVGDQHGVKESRGERELPAARSTAASMTFAASIKTSSAAALAKSAGSASAQGRTLLTSNYELG